MRRTQTTQDRIVLESGWGQMPDNEASRAAKARRDARVYRVYAYDTTDGPTMISPGRIVGHALFEVVGDELRPYNRCGLDAIEVSRAYRRRGLGMKMCRLAEEETGTNLVMPRTERMRKGSERFWEKTGRGRQRKIV